MSNRTKRCKHFARPPCTSAAIAAVGVIKVIDWNFACCCTAAILMFTCSIRVFVPSGKLCSPKALIYPSIRVRSATLRQIVLIRLNKFKRLRRTTEESALT